MTKTISQLLPIGTKISFHSGNFIGHEGIVKGVDENSKHPSAIYGFLVDVELDDGKMVHVEKSEHFTKIK